MQHAKLHNGIILCPAREPFREMFIFSIACIFLNTSTENLIKGHRFLVVLYKSKFYYASRGHYTANYRKYISLPFTALTVIT